MDLAEPDALDEKILRALAHHNPLRRGLGLAEIAPATLRDELLGVAPHVLPFMDVVWELLDNERRAGKQILFEGAQGVLLDVDHGTYPYVTSSNTVAAAAASGFWRSALHAKLAQYMSSENQSMQNAGSDHSLARTRGTLLRASRVKHEWLDLPSCRA